MHRGTRQGDSTGGDNFNLTYSGALDNYSEDRPDENMRAEYEGKQVDLSKATFVDDILEITIDNDIRALDTRLKDNTAQLIVRLSEVGSELEPSKETVILRCAGRGANAQMQLASQEGWLTNGKKPTICF